MCLGSAVRTPLSTAASISAALRRAANSYRAGEHDLVRLRREVLEVLEAEPLARVDYAALVDAESFRPPGTLAVLAVRIGSTRLIDNHLLGDRF